MKTINHDGELELKGHYSIFYDCSRFLRIQWRGKGGGGEEAIVPLLYRGGNFERKCISTTPIGAPIYIWPCNIREKLGRFCLVGSQSGLCPVGRDAVVMNGHDLETLFHCRFLPIVAVSCRLSPDCDPNLAESVPEQSRD